MPPEPNQIRDAIKPALEAAQRMEFASALRALEAAGFAEEQKAAWKRTLQTITEHGALSDPHARLEELLTWDTTCKHVALVLLGWLARYSAYRCDREFTERCAREARRLSPGDGELDLTMAEAQIWHGIWEGRFDERCVRSANLDPEQHPRDCAAHHSLAGLICWSHAQRPLALAHWRRASNLARKSRSPHQQFLANILLARARRRFGQPHLATRILGAMERAAESQQAWRPWLEWERTMSGQNDPNSDAFAAVALGQALQACDNGDREACTRLLRTAQQCANDWPHVCEDVAAISSTFDVGRDQLPQADLLDWQTGEATDLPGAVKGLVVAIAKPREASRKNVDLSTAHFVRVSANENPRRVHARSVPLHAGLARIDAHEARDTKTLTLVAELGLRQGPQPLEHVFEAVYGFAYQPTRHQAIIDTLVYRARKRLEGLASLERQEATLELVPSASFLVADPRDETGLVDRILSLIGAGTHTSATELALALGVSNRTIQRTLKPLLEDGACIQKKQGKAIRYEVEDTTFHEPTEIVAS